MQIPILNGIYTDGTPEIRTSYPVNLVPVPKVSGISNGFLRPGDGIVANGTGPGVDRGGIEWNNICCVLSQRAALTCILSQCHSATNAEVKVNTMFRHCK